MSNCVNELKILIKNRVNVYTKCLEVFVAAYNGYISTQSM